MCLVQHIVFFSYSANKTLTWTWPGFCLLAHTLTERESVMGITKNTLSEGFSRVWKHQICLTVITIKLKLGVCVLASLIRNPTSQILSLFLSWKILKGNSVHVLCQMQGQPKCVYICASGGPLIFFLLWRGDVHARHGSSACHPSVCSSPHGPQSY